MKIQSSGPNILVIGIGDGGINTVNRMIETGVEGVSFVAVDTDAQVLDICKAETVLPIGESITGGTGTGGDVEAGKKAAREKKDSFDQLIKGADLVFLTAGLGGGTGTGAAPIIASAASKRDILTVGVVTSPFPFEGVKRKERSEKGTEELLESVDALVAVSNTSLLETVPGDLPIKEAFRTADGVLQQGVQSISDLVTSPGLINLDLADVRSVLKGVGKAVIGIGEGKGADRTLKATKQASENPILEKESIEGARKLILNVTGGKDLKLKEVNRAAELIREATGEGVDMIFGAVIKNDLENTARVTVIASDFHEKISSEESEPETSFGPVDGSDVSVPTFIRNRNKSDISQSG